MPVEIRAKYLFLLSRASSATFPVQDMMRCVGRCVQAGVLAVCLWPWAVGAITGDEATHQSDHAEDTEVLELPEVHVHGISLNKDQQLGPVPKLTPWPKVPAQLDGKVLDDWMKVRFIVGKNSKATVVVLEPCKHRELTQASLQALNRWTFEPQMKGDEPVDGEITVRIHFRTQ